MDLSAAVLWMSLAIFDLQRPRIAEFVTVVHHSSPIATPAAVTTFGAEEIQTAPAATLDDVLRSVPGFSLFRRSSSRVANPTTQGATLRGLAASGSSRALVLADDVPLNDPVGGWVYWNRVPLAAIAEASVARGAAGDLFGADALAGVVSIRTPATSGGRVIAEGGSHSTGRLSAFGQFDYRRTRVSGAVEGFATNGFVTVAPESRGPIDTAAASRHASASGALTVGNLNPEITVRGSLFRESRDNGTPVQQNATRVAQLSSSAFGLVSGSGAWNAVAYVADQRYEQTFSAVLAGRSAERQTSAQEIGATVFQAQGGYSMWPSFSRGVRLDAQLSAKVVSADLLETPYDTTGAPLRATTTAADQSTFGASAHARYHAAGPIEVGGGVRLERTSSAGEAHAVPNPRLWVTYAPRGSVRFSMAYQSGFRVPTINELYRPFRVGNVLTQANPELEPERSRGFEGGVVWHHRRLTARALTFWSHVDDAIVNVTLSAAGPTILRQRQNAARIRSSGGEFEMQLRLAPGVVLNGSSSYTAATFVRGPLEGLRVPQVPRVQHAVGARLEQGRLRIAVDGRFLGAQFDDDRNAFELDRSTMVDGRAGWRFNRNVEAFVAVENVLDEEQDVGRTPLRTIGLPRTSRAGVRVTF